MEKPRCVYWTDSVPVLQLGDTRFETFFAFTVFLDCSEVSHFCKCVIRRMIVYNNPSDLLVFYLT